MNSSHFDRILRQVLIVPLLAVLLGAAALYWQMHQANVTVAQIQHSDESVAESLLIEKLIDDEETGLRGYQTTGDRAFLQPYEAASRQLPAEFDRRRALALEPGRRAVVSDLHSANEAWRQGFAEPLIAAIAAGAQTSDVELNLVGKRRMDDMRLRLNNLIGVPQQRRDAYIARWHRQVRVMSYALAVVAIFIGLIIGFYTRRQIHEVSDAFRQSHNVVRLRADQAFRSEEKLRTTLQSIADGVITCEPNGRVETMNDVAQQLTGWAAEQARGLPLETVFNIVGQNDRQPIENPVARVKRLNQVAALSHHNILIRKDSTEIVIDDSGAPIRDKSGKLIGLVLVFRDVTMALKSQEALLANEKLAVAGRLAATIAHEIHNPLDSVSNILFLMDGQTTPEESQRFLQLAKQEIARVTHISRAMLSLYRESKAPVAIDLPEMLHSILLLMDRRFATLGVTVGTDLPPNLVVHGFPAELRQVFTNLLTNAAEASGRGSGADGTVRIAARPCPAGFNGDGLRHDAGAIVTVSDSGPGVPPEILPSLFKPFFTTKGERGTGLGLWVSRGIITKHGGAIDLTSSTAPDDHGTTVTVFLANNPTINGGGD